MKTKCVICYKTYNKISNNKTCCKQCSKDLDEIEQLIENKRRKKNINGNCVICNKEFIINTGGKKTCSKECGQKLRLMNKLIYNNINKEILRFKQKTMYDENKDEINNKRRKWREENLDFVRLRQKIYYHTKICITKKLYGQFIN